MAGVQVGCGRGRSVVSRQGPGGEDTPGRRCRCVDGVMGGEGQVTKNLPKGASPALPNPKAPRWLHWCCYHLMVRLCVSNMSASLLYCPTPIGESSKTRCPCQRHSALLSKGRQCHCWPFCCNNLITSGGRWMDAPISWRMMYVYTHITDLRREVGGVRYGNYRTG